MEQDLGYRKVVFKDGNRIKVIRGNCFSDGEFIRVETNDGNVYLNKYTVMVIKGGDDL